jgi:hypothetical protein
MRKLSYAKDRTDDCRRKRQKSYLPVCPAQRNSFVKSSERLQCVPYGQIYPVGERRLENVAECVAVAARKLKFMDLFYSTVQQGRGAWSTSMLARQAV